MRNISWCPCLKVRVNFYPRRNYAVRSSCQHLETVVIMVAISPSLSSPCYYDCMNIYLFSELINCHTVTVGGNATSQKFSQFFPCENREMLAALSSAAMEGNPPVAGCLLSARL